MENKLPLIPYRPYPVQNECFIAYMLRLAIENGKPSLNKLGSAYGVKITNRWHPNNRDAIKFVSELTGHSSKLILDKCLPPNLRSVVYDDNRVIKSLFLSQPRICPLCVESDQPHDCRWQLLPYTHCPKHGIHLLGACDRCNKPFKWDHSIKGIGCTNCARLWSEMGPSEVSELPDYYKQLHFHDDQGSLRTYLSDLIAAAVKLIRPFDSLIDRIESPNQAIKAWPGLFSQGYELLTSKSRILEYKIQCMNNRTSVSQLGSNAVELPISILEQHVSSKWEFTNYQSNTIEIHEGVPFLALNESVRPARIKNIKKDLDKNLKYQVDLNGLADVLGCNSSDISYLLEKETFRPCNGARLSRDSIFNLKRIAETVQVQNYNPSSHSSFVHTTQLDKILPLFNACKGVLIEGIKNRKIIAAKDNSANDFLSGLYLESSSVRLFLESHLKKTCDDIISTKHAAKILGLTQGQLNRLKNTRLIEPYHWRDGHYTVKGLIALLEGYHVLPRESVLAGHPIESIQDQFSSMGSEPTFERIIYPKKT